MIKPKDTPRLVRPRVWTALGTVAAAGLAASTPVATTAAVVGASVAPPSFELAQNTGAGKGTASQLRQGGEGEGAEVGGDEADFLAAIGFMEGHLRAGLKLYETGDLAAAKTHMGHPIKEKYNAVAPKLEERGFGDLKATIVALADAAEAEQSVAEIQSLFAAVSARIDAVQAGSPGGAGAGLLSLSRLTRIAAAEYADGTKGGEISNLHEYQDSWGFLRTVEAEAKTYAASTDASIAKAGQAILEQVRGLDSAFGDIQGQGDMTMDSTLLYAAAARIELAALTVK